LPKLKVDADGRVVDIVLPGQPEYETMSAMHIV
jgi:hypothetical protein